MNKKSPQSFENLPEIFVSNRETTSVVSKAVKSGRLKKIGSKLYTKNLTQNPTEIVRRNCYTLLKEYFPDALISDRTALENQPAKDGTVFIISAKTREVRLPGITLKPRKGHPPLESDKPFLGGTRLSSIPRAWLENMKPSREIGGRVSRTISKEDLEQRLDKLLRQGGEKALNQLRDDAREIGRQIGMEPEFHELDELIGTFLGTREATLLTEIGKARKKGLPHDPDRERLFLTLFEELRDTALETRPTGAMSNEARSNLAFFEAYFSNYIEGTEFTVEEAINIVFKSVIPEDRPADAHDILGTFRIVSDQTEMARIPRNFKEFLSFLRNRHIGVMEGRGDKKPGYFKTKNNQAGNTLFVAPDLVEGTLQKGFEIYRGVDAPLRRAIFMMFLVSEVHPFVDGNGRVARIMMNAELVADSGQKIIIPTIFRNNYLSAIKTLSQSGRAAPFIRVLDFAQKYTAAIPWGNFGEARKMLQNTNAFRDANEAEEIGIRLVLPKTLVEGN